MDYTSTVLVCSWPSDRLAEAVARHLRANGGEVLRSTPRRLLDATLSWSLNFRNSSFCASLGFRELESERLLAGILFRDNRANDVPSAEYGSANAQYRSAESRAGLYSLIACSVAEVINRPSALGSERVLRAPDIWSAAKDLGLSIHDWLVTSDPAAAEAFTRDHPLGVLQTPLTATKPGGTEDSDHVELRSPILFTERLIGRSVRVHVVGTTVSAERVDGVWSPAIDSIDRLTQRYVAVNIDRALMQGCRKLASRLQLRFAQMAFVEACTVAKGSDVVRADNCVLTYVDSQPSLQRSTRSTKGIVVSQLVDLLSSARR